MKTFFINTLGCKVNQYESQQIRELLERLGLDQVQTITSRLPDANDRSIQWRRIAVGSADGRILYDGKSPAGCQVKLVRILKPQSVIEMFNIVREGAEFTAVTDENGKYHFDRLPVGAYKLKWQLPSDKGWIRRLQDKPDAVITEGKAAVLKPVETRRRLLSR